MRHAAAISTMAAALGRAVIGFAQGRTQRREAGV